MAIELFDILSVGVLRLAVPNTNYAVQAADALLDVYDNKIERGITIDLPTAKMTIPKTGIYQAAFTFIGDMGSNDELKLTYYANGSPTPYAANIQGAGVGKPIAVSNTTFAIYNQGDEIQMYAVDVGAVGFNMNVITCNLSFAFYGEET